MPIVTTALVIGFDSAWSENNSGALVGVLRKVDGSYETLGDPQTANFHNAEKIIGAWQKKHSPGSVLILIDQPTIVNNLMGQRPVENIISSPVSKRYGGVQPANRGKAEMFGDKAPIWRFLENFGGPVDPTKKPMPSICTIETYPVLALIAMNWILDDPRSIGRLPKYNPEQRKQSFRNDWEFVCRNTMGSFKEFGLLQLVEWLGKARDDSSPLKSLQDCLDACLCLLVGIHVIEKKDCLFVGNMETGYMVVPYGRKLHEELEVRCGASRTKRKPSEWIMKFKLS